MINNRKAYKIFMNLTETERKKLSVEYEIEEVDNYENKKWNNRFFSFWNWLWMKHKKEHTVELSRLIQVFNNNIWNNKKSVK